MRWQSATLLVALVAPASSLAAQAPATKDPDATREARVIDDYTFVYQEPSLDSPVLRRLYSGELLSVLEGVSARDESVWVKVSLGFSRHGYVRTDKLGQPTTLPVTPWKAPEVVRDERPLGFALRGGGETLGVALNIRYQPFSRLGISLGAGSVLDNKKMKGTHLAVGLYTFIVLWNLSPFVEAGFSRASYHKGLSKLALTNFYMSVGVEWMFDWGLFIDLHGTYMRSADVEVAFEYTDAKAGNLQAGHYGALDLGDTPSYQALTPGVSIGYAF